MMDPKCADFERLRSEVDAKLQHLIELTTLLQQVFRAGDYKVFSRYDREFENSVGQKERAIGALRQHSIEHRCQPAKTEFMKEFRE